MCHVVTVVIGVTVGLSAMLGTLLLLNALQVPLLVLSLDIELLIIRWKQWRDRRKVVKHGTSKT